jgi:hypothetical protein
MNIERARTLLTGTAAGLMISVYYLRGSTAPDFLNELRDGALLLVLVCVGLSVLQQRSARKHRLS